MHFSKMHFRKMHFSKILQIFGGLVLGCIKTKFCKKICVGKHLSSIKLWRCRWTQWSTCLLLLWLLLTANCRRCAQVLQLLRHVPHAVDQAGWAQSLIPTLVDEGKGGQASVCVLSQDASILEALGETKFKRKFRQLSNAFNEWTHNRKRLMLDATLRQQKRLTLQMKLLQTNARPRQTTHLTVSWFNAENGILLHVLRWTRYSEASLPLPFTESARTLLARRPLIRLTVVLHTIFEKLETS